MIRAIDVIGVEGCCVKDEEGAIIAVLWERNKKVKVERKPACTLGVYFYLLWYLTELGFEVE